MPLTSQVLDRVESRPWSAKCSACSLGALGIAVLVGIGIFTFRNVEMWTPLQGWDWTEYLTTKTFHNAPGDYQLLEQVRTHGKQLMAFETHVVPDPLQEWPPIP